VAPPTGMIASRPAHAAIDPFRFPSDSLARGTVRANTLWSQSLGTRKQYVVYLPPSYATDTARRYPVVFYLHGLWGNEWDWVRSGRLDAAMDSLARTCPPDDAARPALPCASEMIVVMPDGDDGWYTTWNALGNWSECQRQPMREGESVASYCVPWPKYDDYIAHDLVARVDSGYRTLARREHRGIAGLSMGGYGAVTLALRYPDVFAAAASHSGVLSPFYAGPRPFEPPPRYATDVDTLQARAARLWPWMRLAFGRDTAAWLARDPARLAGRLARAEGERGGPMPALRFDTGRDDQLVVDGNRAFAHELYTLGVPHHYVEFPGRHDWAYWRTHVEESLAWLAGLLAPAGAPR
ncbi:MAG: esterase family protein, partial [Gemmatimonadota bacterium]|nr:esterase family protein [Gemmatimonadota bacterium]